MSDELGMYEASVGEFRHVQTEGLSDQFSCVKCWVFIEATGEAQVMDKD